MSLPLPQKLIDFAKTLDFPLYVVGGYVRDCLANLASGKHDTDVCAPVSADKFLKAAGAFGARATAVYKNTGTVKFELSGEEYEFSPFRSDEYVRGTHSPVKTFFTDDITLDARRRDFKCNAVYYGIAKGEFSDPLGGIEDIKNKIMTTVAPPEKVFGEDGLRLMRLARQSAQTGFKPSGECLRGAAANRSLISDISAERIYAELDAILHADERYGVQYAQYEGLKILDITGVLDMILPELTAGRGMAQNASFHAHDVLEHSLRTVRYSDPKIRLAALLHDIGKPKAYSERGNTYGHEKDSAQLAENVCARLKVPKKLTSETVRLCAAHMYDLRLDARESKIRRFIVKNYDIFDKILLIKQADFSGCRDDLSIAPCVSKWRAIFDKMVEECAPFTLKQLAVRGNELIEIGVEPSETGEILQYLLEECAAGVLVNDRQKLLAYTEKTFLNK